MIFAPPMAVTAQLEGIHGLSQRIATNITTQYGGDLEFAMYGKDSKATMIALVQADSAKTKVKWKRDVHRNPFYFNKETLQLIRAAIPALFNAAAGVRRGTQDYIKQIMLLGVLQNAKAEKDRGGGKFTPLNPAYARRKAKKFGFKPILQATGDLLGGLKVLMTKGGGRA